MDFTLTEEHRMIQQAARDFAQTELLPGVIERDEKQEFPAAIISDRDACIPSRISCSVASFSNWYFSPAGGATRSFTLCGRSSCLNRMNESPRWVWALMQEGIINPFAIGFSGGVPFWISLIFLSLSHSRYPVTRPSLVRISPWTYVMCMSVRNTCF